MRRKSADERARREGGRPAVEVLPPEGGGRFGDLEQLAHVLDTLFVVPGTRFRIGIDGLIGLFPVVGDSVSALLSSYLLYRAAQEGFPLRVLLRMFWNLVIDGVVGAVPVFGDAFDLAFKANRRNLEIMRRHASPAAARRDRPRDSRQVARLFLVLALLTGLAIIGLAAFAAAALISLIRG